LGGEDFELLVAMPPEFAEREAQSLGIECGVALTRIGTLAPGQGASFWSGGTLVELTGFSHFA
jgi:thiamine monophosphate kinase